VVRNCVLGDILEEINSAGLENRIKYSLDGTRGRCNTKVFRPRNVSHNHQLFQTAILAFRQKITVIPGKQSSSIQGCHKTHMDVWR
jgi:hypothetical protein